MINKELTVKEYLDFLEDRNLNILEHADIESKSNLKKFSDTFPWHKIAICPFCNRIYSEVFDTYSLKLFEWSNYRIGSYLAGEKLSKRCRHFFKVDYFLNFNGHIPDISNLELDSHVLYHCEKPHVMACLFQEPYFECKAVIHSFPIHKIVEDKFEPRYTLYVITYYCPEDLKSKNRDTLNNNNDDAFFAPPSDLEANPESWWDLKKWVEEDKLYWIDPKAEKFTLIKNSIENFPYGNIQGRVEPYWDEMPPNPFRVG